MCEELFDHPAGRQRSEIGFGGPVAENEKRVQAVLGEMPAHLLLDDQSVHQEGRTGRQDPDEREVRVLYAFLDVSVDALVHLPVIRGHHRLPWELYRGKGLTCFSAEGLGDVVYHASEVLVASCEHVFVSPHSDIVVYGCEVP